MAKRTIVSFVLNTNPTQTVGGTLKADKKLSEIVGKLKDAENMIYKSNGMVAFLGFADHFDEGPIIVDARLIGAVVMTDIDLDAMRKAAEDAKKPLVLVDDPFSDGKTKSLPKEGKVVKIKEEKTPA